MARKKLVAGNWKMNGLLASKSLLLEISREYGNAACDILVCPPATLINALRGGTIAIGGQDCHWNESGAHTGDISAAMLADAGADAVILGHSERRTDHGETDEMVAKKTEAAWKAGLMAVVCVGETGDERDAGTTLDRIGAQLDASIPDGATGKNLVVAYEPVWAIGTGRIPEMSDIAEVHDFIRSKLKDRFGGDTAEAVRVLYGGSVKPGNAEEIFAVSNVDGALVGGASLKAEDFGGIISAAK
ncbi:triose-phosphate isomerase [Amaricoccus tamworthensis]|uniref:triose-phosphate isomerase n=1 Tax=Amaricoccus tamworthensis TaxID=57002 RepID=UPI003C7E3002